MTDVLLVQNYS